MKSNYHYEYAAYTDNLYWGRKLICRDRNLAYVKMVAASAGKGCYVIEKKRIAN